MPNLNKLSYSGVVKWLENALKGKGKLPLLSDDEPFYLGIATVDKSLNSRVSHYLREAAVNLVRELCALSVFEKHDILYSKELLSLIAELSIEECVPLLTNFAISFPDQVPLEVRLKVLGTLVDTRPSQPSSFWIRILEADPSNNAPSVLSGVLSTTPFDAVKLLPKMPDDEETGNAAVLKLEIAWDNLPATDRFGFLETIEVILPECGKHFQKPLVGWVRSKGIKGAITELKKVSPKFRELLNEQVETLNEGLSSRLGILSGLHSQNSKLSLDQYTPSKVSQTAIQSQIEIIELMCNRCDSIMDFFSLWYDRSYEFRVSIWLFSAVTEVSLAATDSGSASTAFKELGGIKAIEDDRLFTELASQKDIKVCGAEDRVVMSIQADKKELPYRVGFLLLEQLSTDNIWSFSDDPMRSYIYRNLQTVSDQIFLDITSCIKEKEDLTKVGKPHPQFILNKSLFRIGADISNRYSENVSKNDNSLKNVKNSPQPEEPTYKEISNSMAKMFTIG